MTNKGLQLAELGIYVFPCGQDKHPIIPKDKGGNGHLDATTDPKVIQGWIDTYGDVLWGVHTGRSGLLAADIDRKSGKDGFVSIKEAWLELPPTFNYSSRTGGGEHHLYLAPEGRVLPPAVPYRGMAGLDRKSGSSYVIFWGEPPASREEFQPAPKWLLDEGVQRTGAAFDGGLDAWLEQLEPGGPTPKVKAVIDSFPADDFGHSDMVAQQMELVRLGAERHSGIWIALDALRTLWLNRDPRLHSTPEMDWAYKFDEALYSGIAKYGATSDLLSNLPVYSDTVDKLPKDFDVDNLLWGEPQHRAHLFKVMEALLRTELTDEEILSVLWSAPTTKRWAVEWGEKYLMENIGLKRLETPRVLDESELGIIEPPKDKSPDEYMTLLTDEEREYVRGTHTWVDLYLDWVRTRLPTINEPYHIMNALTILSSAYAPYGYIDGETYLNLNLYCISLGESSTGKTQSEAYRDRIIRYMYETDPSYETGDNPSPNGLHEFMINRDRKWSLFSSAEIAGFLQTAGPSAGQSWMMGMLTFLTKVYDGIIPPMPRVGKTQDTKTAFGYLSIAAFGTPEKVYDLLTEDLFTDGFLARFLWSFGNPNYDTNEPYVAKQQKHGSENVHEDPDIRMAVETLIPPFNTRTMINQPDDVLERISSMMDRLMGLARNHELSRLIQPSFRRLGDNIRKIAALFAMSEGFKEIKMRHLLQALRLGETFMNNAVLAARHVTETKLQRDLDSVYNWLMHKGGSALKTETARKFAGKFGRDYKLIIVTLQEQGLIEEVTVSGKDRYKIIVH